jgi:hypothetical protein
VTYMHDIIMAEKEGWPGMVVDHVIIPGTRRVRSLLVRYKGKGVKPILTTVKKNMVFFAILILWCQHTKTARILTIYYFPAGIFSNPPSPPPPTPDLDCINANFRHIYEEP